MAESRELINKVAKYLEKYMAKYDGSHDFHHLERVVGLSHAIHNQIKKTEPSTNLDPIIITLSALLHDVGDRKYVTEEEDPDTMIRELLLGLGADKDLAEKVQTIYGGAKTREMDDSMAIFESNLLRMEASMKTEPGKQMAKRRTEILKQFRKWWDEEAEIGGVGASVLKSALDGESSGGEKESSLD